MRGQHRKLAHLLNVFTFLFSSGVSILLFLNISRYSASRIKNAASPIFVEGASCTWSPFGTTEGLCNNFLKSISEYEGVLQLYFNEMYDPYRSNGVPFISLMFLLVSLLSFTAVICKRAWNLNHRQGTLRFPYFPVGIAFAAFPYLVTSFARHSLNKGLIRKTQQLACLLGCLYPDADLKAYLPDDSLGFMDSNDTLFSFKPGFTALCIFGALLFSFILDTTLKALHDGQPPPWINWVINASRRGGAGISRCFGSLWCCGNRNRAQQDGAAYIPLLQQPTTAANADAQRIADAERTIATLTLQNRELEIQRLMAENQRLREALPPVGGGRNYGTAVSTGGGGALPAYQGVAEENPTP